MFEWDASGEWSYVDIGRLGYTLEVPTENGMEEIDVLHPSEAKETLGVFMAPDGNSTAQLKKWGDKVKKWVDRVSLGKLPAGFTWVSYTYQLWMSLRYSLGTIPADMEEIDDFLQDQNYKMLSFLGVNKKIRKGWRTTHRAFLWSWPLQFCHGSIHQQTEHLPTALRFSPFYHYCLMCLSRTRATRSWLPRLPLLSPIQPTWTAAHTLLDLLPMANDRLLPCPTSPSLPCPGTSMGWRHTPH